MPQPDEAAVPARPQGPQRFVPPRPEPVVIPGPAGPLEALLEEPAGHAGTHFAVLCHPHPLHGGTMTNKVVHTVARSFQERGVATIRFNFRGVGASAGVFDSGGGETADALAVVAWGRARWPGAGLWLGGFSFGGVVAIRASMPAGAAMLVTVAPAIARLDVAGALPACPWLIVQGDSDDVVPATEVLAWASGLDPKPTVVVIPGAGHYFHGRLHELREAVLTFTR